MTQNLKLFNEGLSEDAVHIFYLTIPDGFGNLNLSTDRIAQVLTATEWDRFRRYRIQRRRNDLLLSRIMFQVIISRLGLNRDQPCWIEADTRGKPFVMSQTGRASYHVNTSDTAGMITWTISRHGPLGCDVEPIVDDKDEVAVRCFAPVELASYRALTGVAKQRRFFELWTLKEAVLKADGRGFAIPLSSFYFRLDPNHDHPQPYYEVTDHKQGPAPGPWRFLSFRSHDTHQLAAAVSTSHKVTFYRHALSLVNYDKELAQPWRFALNTGEGQPTEDQEFGAYLPF